MARPKLLFLRPHIQSGLNLTVRRGDKWLHACRVGAKLEVADTASPQHTICEVKVVGLMSFKFDDIPEPLLAYELTLDCRDYDGLFKAMDRAYHGFDGEDQCTLIFFERV